MTPEGKIQISSVGTKGLIVKGNLRCGVGYTHLINTVSKDRTPASGSA